MTRKYFNVPLNTILDLHNSIPCGYTFRIKSKLLWFLCRWVSFIRYVIEKNIECIFARNLKLDEGWWSVINNRLKNCRLLRWKWNWRSRSSTNCWSWISHNGRIKTAETAIKYIEQKEATWIDIRCCKDSEEMALIRKADCTYCIIFQTFL